MKFRAFASDPTALRPKNSIQMRTLTPGRPFTPRPVILNKDPAGFGCCSGADTAAVVTNRISKSGPPNAADVTCSTGSLISRSTLPVLRNADINLEKCKFMRWRRFKRFE